MSNIPSTAVTAAFVPVQRSTNEAIRARKVQTQKDFHHNEEVEELDDTAVNSVNDQNQKGGRDAQQKKREDEERVEIEALKDVPQAARNTQARGGALDISA